MQLNVRLGTYSPTRLGSHSPTRLGFLPPQCVSTVAAVTKAGKIQFTKEGIDSLDAPSAPLRPAAVPGAFSNYKANYPTSTLRTITRDRRFDLWKHVMALEG